MAGNASSWVAPNYAFPPIHTYPTFGGYSFTESKTEVLSKSLREIVTSDGYKIDFQSYNNRIDLNGAKRLDKIQIKKNEQLVKEFAFDYEYGYSSELQPPYTYDLKRPRYHYNASGNFIGFSTAPFTASYTRNVTNDLRFRLFLKSIKEKGADGIELPPYQFDYNNINGLPYKTSLYHDGYGYAKDGPNHLVLSKLLSGVLKKLTYPTGGYKEFELEISGNINSTNGLRIKEVKEFSEASSSPMLTTYTYGDYQATDYAHNGYTMPDIVRIHNSTGKLVVLGNKELFTTNRANDESLTRGSVGGYTFTEIRQPGNGTHRFEFTNAENYPDSYTNTDIVSNLFGGFQQNMDAIGYLYPFPRKTSNDWKRGLILNEFFRNEDGKLLKSKHYDYDFSSFANGSKPSKDLKVSRYRIDIGIGWDWNLYGASYFVPRWQLLKSLKERDYAPDGITYIENSNEYLYDKKSFNYKEYLFITEQSQINSKGEKVVEKTRYPLDYPFTSDDFGVGILRLRQEHVLNAVIEKYKYVQDPVTGSKRYVAGIINKYYGSKPFVKQVLGLQSADVNYFYESNSSAYYFVHDQWYRPIANFKYDNIGNTLEQNKEGDIKEAYIWDYKYSLPIAKTTNAEAKELLYTSFEADGNGKWGFNQDGIINGKGITGSKYFDISYTMYHTSTVDNPTLSSDKKYIISLWAKGGTPGVNVNHPDGSSTTLLTSYAQPKYVVGEWKYFEVEVEYAVGVGIWKWGHEPNTYVDEVRLFPAGAQMTTYTYQPAAGITSQCDANNRISYYEYDGLQRLKLIRDQEGNVVKTFEYNYKK